MFPWDPISLALGVPDHFVERDYSRNGHASRWNASDVEWPLIQRTINLYSAAHGDKPRQIGCPAEREEI
jgi:hypothetical protein